jgi:polyketide cyclase/dehydrase/lipid transport protein
VRRASDHPRYRFVETWRVDVPGPVVYDVLADLPAYPEWWPQVRSVEGIDDDSARVVCRSLLPYSLRFDMVRARDDRRAGVLEARLRGDLDGWARWTVRESKRSSVLLYEQQVTTPGHLLRALARVGRPALELNHAWMMRAGRQGLQRRLRAATASVS